MKRKMHNGSDFADGLPSIRRLPSAVVVCDSGGGADLHDAVGRSVS